MNAPQIADNLYYVGAVDWHGRDFHGYSRSPMGTTYNAFLLKGDKNVLFDTVKEEHWDEMLCRIHQVMSPEDVDWIVANHLEPDHAGALARAVAACKPEKVFVSPMGEKALKEHFFDVDWPLEVIEPGGSVSTGSHTIHFVETRMLHWPDNMFSYIEEIKTMISSDAFGQNIASEERFADEIEPWVLERTMKEYYGNIVLPFSPIVLKVLDKVEELKLDVRVLAPDHGLIFRGEDVCRTLERYKAFAQQKPTMKAVVVWDTMWRSTERMADAICQGLASGGVHVHNMYLKSNHHSAVMTEVMDAGAVLVGSPTHNNGILPKVAGMLTYMKGLKPQNKIGAAFGSFGWSGESVKLITDWLTDMKFDLPAEGLRIKNRPSHDDYAACNELGKTVAAALKEKVEAAG